ncbi:response regulator transcription factor [Acidovorax sp. MR-S7]|uniref:response regulator n=1 Tax=Acidovorax sp. MR-S7 TaxID=1268622 RepID=UPI000380C05D|nr:response regulator transcription factor [Acidovorax sp. MR-S7]GAD22745.1 response regulator [Acidovorax sp. MR-S7]
MSAAIRVLIGDDHRIVREGLKQVLGDPANGLPEITVAAEATQGGEVLAQVAALQGGLDLVLLDIAMPGMDGLEVLQALRRDWPALPVLMLSTYPERQYAVRCIQLGASGYLHKSADPDDMVAAVRKAAAGGRYLTEATALALVGAVQRTSMVKGAPVGIDALSYREHQVFRLLIAGHSVGEIGAQLQLASNTVSTYRARILEKTGARNDVELALLAHGAPEA